MVEKASGIGTIIDILFISNTKTVFETLFQNFHGVNHYFTGAIYSLDNIPPVRYEKKINSRYEIADLMFHD